MYNGPSGPRRSLTIWTSSGWVAAALNMALTVKQIILLALIRSFSDGNRTNLKHCAALTRRKNFADSSYSVPSCDGSLPECTAKGDCVPSQHSQKTEAAGVY